MAVEARHLNLFPPQLLGNREMMMNTAEANASIFNTQMGYGVPLSGTTTTTEALLPKMYSSVITDSINIPQKAPIKSESALSYNHLAAAAATAAPPRKRPRESFSPLLFSCPTPPQSTNNNNNHNNTTPFSFLGEDISLQIQHQQLDVDRLVSEHMEKLRMEMEEKRKRQARMIIEAIEEGMMKRLKAREEEIEKIGKLNWALEEKVKSLCIENQIWRDLAQTNEATANALRSNLEQVLAAAAAAPAHFKDERSGRLGPGLMDDTGAAEMMDDAQSCCGSCSDDGDGRTLANGDAQDKGCPSEGGGDGGGGSSSSSRRRRRRRLCRNCGREESCVLLLPCRHLCLCTACGSSLRACPICKSTMDDSFHVNMS
uniref:RING-type domain-containing protein n=2 Tax=Rhizophora mucronata TaxID=61149 RepID=A0A2P2JCM1_RHIMU